MFWGTTRSISLKFTSVLNWDINVRHGVDEVESDRDWTHDGPTSARSLEPLFFPRYFPVRTLKWRVPCRNDRGRVQCGVTTEDSTSLPPLLPQEINDVTVKHNVSPREVYTSI